MKSPECLPCDAHSVASNFVASRMCVRLQFACTGEEFVHFSVAHSGRNMPCGCIASHIVDSAIAGMLHCLCSQVACRTPMGTALNSRLLDTRPNNAPQSNAKQTNASKVKQSKARQSKAKLSKAKLSKAKQL